jgi:hypothetical protein
MAIDYARYMVENPDVYDMFRKPGSGRPNWTWDNGRKEGQYRREDGNMTSAETAAQYAQNHYNNFGKREGRKQHQRVDGSYEERIRQIDGGGGGGNAPTEAMMMSVTALTAQIAELKKNGGSQEEINALKEESKTLLTDFGYNYEEDSKKKKKSFLSASGQ